MLRGALAPADASGWLSIAVRLTKSSPTPGTKKGTSKRALRSPLESFNQLRRIEFRDPVVTAHWKQQRRILVELITHDVGVLGRVVVVVPQDRHCSEPMSLKEELSGQIRHQIYCR